MIEVNKVADEIEQAQKDPYAKIDQELRQVLTSPDQTGYVNISHGNWEKYHVREYILEGNLTCCTLPTKLYLGNNQESNMVQLLTHVGFPFLKGINIWGNIIQSVELLCRVYLPNITNFAINGNHLVSALGFKKCNWPHLDTIGLSSNKFKEMEVLTQMHSPKMNRLILAFQTGDTMFQDQRWMAKMEATPGTVYMIDEAKIKQNYVEVVLRRRNPLMGIRK